MRISSTRSPRRPSLCCCPRARHPPGLMQGWAQPGPARHRHTVQWREDGDEGTPRWQGAWEEGEPGRATEAGAAAIPLCS